MSKAERIKAEKTKEIRALIAGYLIRSGYTKVSVKTNGGLQ